MCGFHTLLGIEPRILLWEEPYPASLEIHYTDTTLFWFSRTGVGKPRDQVIGQESGKCILPNESDVLPKVSGVPNGIQRGLERFYIFTYQ